MLFAHPAIQGKEKIKSEPSEHTIQIVLRRKVEKNFYFSLLPYS